MKKLIPVVLFLLILLLAIGGGIYYHFSHKTKELTEVCLPLPP